MATAAEHGQIVLAAIIPSRRDLLEKALRQLTPAHFPERIQANVFTMLERYSEATSGGVMPLKYLDDLLRQKDPGQHLLYKETFQLYEETNVEEAEFLWSVAQLRDLAAEKATGEVITQSMEILRNGTTAPTGELIKGHADARSHILEAFANIDRDLTMQDAPEGDMQEETGEIIQDYLDNKNSRASGVGVGVQFGITELDAKVGGMQNGDLVLIAGYTSDGKTTMCTQMAWSAAVEQGKNVVYLTTETSRAVVRRKIVARHSKMPIFGLPEGLNTHDLRQGTLDAEKEAKLQEVVGDLTGNPEYGHIYIAQVPRSSTISSIEQRLYRLQRAFHIDMVIIDYLALMVTERRLTAREEMQKIMRDAKQVATTFDNGRGVVIVSPWQVTRAAREKAESLGMYSSASLSETAEASNISDIIVGLLAPTDNSNRYAEITLQLLKHRDGVTANSIMVDVDYATGWFRSRGGPAFDSILGVSRNDSFGPTGLDSLIN